MKPFAYFDFEVLPNFVCVDFFLNGVHETIIHTDEHPAQIPAIKHYTDNCTLVGFNNKHYDDVMLGLVLAGASVTEIYQTSVAIIEHQAQPWDIVKQKGLALPFYSIDIMPLLPGKAGLKLYSARVHTKVLEELPVNPHEPVSTEQIKHLILYCQDDTIRTKELAMLLDEELKLCTKMSAQYQIDLMSSSGPQIAAKVLGYEYERITSVRPEVPAIGSQHVPLTMKYQKPDWINFKTEKYQLLLDEILDDTFMLNQETGHVIMGPSVADRIVPTEDGSVALGIGGMHSIDCAGFYRAGANHTLLDIDVASMYPNMIINAGWYPSHLGPEFLDVYKKIVADRLEAKHNGDKVVADSLKLVVNSSFGLFSNRYSILFSPNLLLNVTLTGQLTLLMLIERLELHGFLVISANTDGIIIKPKTDEVDLVKKVVSKFELETQLSLEYTEYSMYVRQSVNHYFAIKKDGTTKGKGIFQTGQRDTSHNPTGNIIAKSIIEWFKGYGSLEETIGDSKDIRDFLVVRTVNGGAVKDGIPIGKIIRWYYSTQSETGINYQSNGNQVPKSIKGVPLMNITDDLPPDLD
jgi:hypothetical protein